MLISSANLLLRRDPSKDWSLYNTAFFCLLSSLALEQRHTYIILEQPKFGQVKEMHLKISRSMIVDEILIRKS